MSEAKGAPPATPAAAHDLVWPAADAARVVQVALAEDLGPEGLDVTSGSIQVPDGPVGRLVARADGVLAGLPVLTAVITQVEEVLRARGELDARTQVALRARDGAAVRRGDVLAELDGPVLTQLMAERTLLNIVCRLSGVATHTRRWVDALAGTGTQVLDTRKTTPGLRSLEKYAVRAGGGVNKRMGLYDVAMIKDNHVLAAGGVTQAYDAVRARHPEVPVEVEVTTVAEAIEALERGARWLMCDNFPAPELTSCVAAIREWSQARGERVDVEATGGLTLKVAADYAATGIDHLSVGALTHSSPVLDLALDL